MERFIIAVEIDPEDSEDFIQAIETFFRIKVPVARFGINKVEIVKEKDLT